MALHSYKQGEFSDTLVEKQRNGFSEFLDTRWSGVGAHMGDHELEEGEACDDPDSGCDPDTAFSYLDEKLSMVLGDVQKFFEGGVSAEKLGSKFGGYGSFLPTQERTPSILHQDKPATVVASDAYCRTKKSSNEGTAEKTKRPAAGSSVRASNSKAGSSSAVVMHENGGRDAGPVNERMSNVDNAFPAGRVEENTGVRKKVTLRIKMGSDTSERKKNTTIYSDFGLSNSSSASEEDDEDQRTDSDVDSSPDRTPLSMIRIMTSHHIPDGMLLSPLPDLVTEPFMQKERLWSTNRENLNERVRSPCPKKVDLKHDLDLAKDDGDAFEKMDNSREKAKEYANERKGDSAISSDHIAKRAKGDKDRGGSKESSRHSSKPPSKAFAKDLPKSNEISVERQARDAVSESGTGVRSIDTHKEFKGSSVDNRVLPDYPSYEAEHDPKDFCSPFQPPKEVDSGRELLSRGYRVEKAAASSSHDSMNEHLDMSHQGRDAGKEVSNTFETNLHGKRHLDVCPEPVDGRKRSSAKEFIAPSEGKTNSGQDAKISISKGNGKFALPAVDFPTTNRELGRDVLEGRKRSKDSVKEANVSRGSSKERGKEPYKEARKSSGKEKHIKTSSSRDPMADETPKDGPQHSFKAIVNKDFQQVDLPKVHKTDSVEHKRRDKSKERIRSDYPSKEPTKFSEKDRHKEVAMRDTSTKASQPASVPEAVLSDKPSQPGALPPPSTENPIPPYVMITEHWVACDKCEKWRLLPPGVDEGHFVGKWRCKMLNWLEGMNNCSVPEEVTTQATQALKNIAAAMPPPTQEIPPVVEQVQPPAPVVTPLPPPATTNPSQEAKFPDRTKAAGSKKRKIPPTTSIDAAVQGRSKSLPDASQVIHEASQAKLGGGDANPAQERIQAKLGGSDLTHVKAGDEKHKVKEREKVKRSRPNSGASPLGKEHSQATPANVVLREATDLKHHADRLKGSGKEQAKTLMYLQAALKFLQAASMRESEGSEQGENKHDTLPLNIYADTAKLCEYCAASYERSKDLAAAALAYKCAGLAWMRVVQSKSSGISKDREVVQVAHHQAAPGESPSSSTAIDVDTLNNSAMDKLPTRGAASPALNSHTGGSFIITAKSRPSLNRILQYAADTNAAVDALSKSYNAFTAAESASMCSSDGMSALKRVLEFSFHDVESLVRLVRIALQAMGHY
eukprot:c12832_g1_i1 orf=269-3829(+)